jgi:hypothetical protein
VFGSGLRAPALGKSYGLHAPLLSVSINSEAGPKCRIQWDTEASPFPSSFLRFAQQRSSPFNRISSDFSAESVTASAFMSESILLDRSSILSQLITCWHMAKAPEVRILLYPCRHGCISSLDLAFVQLKLLFNQLRCLNRSQLFLKCICEPNLASHELTLVLEHRSNSY